MPYLPAAALMYYGFIYFLWPCADNKSLFDFYNELVNLRSFMSVWAVAIIFEFYGQLW